MRRSDLFAAPLFPVATPALADGGTRGALEVLGTGMLVSALMLAVFGGTASVVVVRALLPSAGSTSRVLALLILPVVTLGSGGLLIRETREVLECRSYHLEFAPDLAIDCLDGFSLSWRAALLAFSGWAFVRIVTAHRRRSAQALAAITEGPPADSA
jgi:hypothetical protein